MNEEKIIQYLKGELDPQESKELRDWILSDKANFETFKQLKQAWALSNAMKESEPIDEKDYHIFRLRNFSDDDEDPEKRTLSPFQWILRIAAVFLMIAGVYQLFTFVLPNKSSDEDLFTEITTKAGEKSKVVLADSSVIWINSCTKLRYPVNLKKSKINFYLEGEAFFDLKKIPNRNITVHTSNINIKVIGTAFNLKSYANDNNIETTLIRGKIAIETSINKENASKQIMLLPNQSATYFKNNKQLDISEVKEKRITKTETIENLEIIANQNRTNLIVEESISTKPQVLWKDGKLIFEKETLENLSKKMERWYDVKINIESERLKKARFSGTFDKESVEQALKALSYPVPFNYSIIKDSIIIKNR
jgi:ferric-dicitrate binding protein FerR (iron transport regulator)